MSYFELGHALPGNDPAHLKEALLQKLLEACLQHPYVEVIELRHVDGEPGYDLIVVDIGDASVAPDNRVGVAPKERLALAYRPERDTPFEVRALRRDFPETLHLNGVPDDEPKSLCLYQDWDSAERGWTAPKFLGRILWWLEKTADETLHAADQSLEQVFFSEGVQLILPNDLSRAVGNTGYELRITGKPGSKRKVVMRADVRAISDPHDTALPLQVLLVPIQPVGHPPIQAAPSDMGQLQKILARAGTSLFPALTEQIRAKAEGGLVPTHDAERRRVLLLLQIPRHRDGEYDRTDLEAFSLEADLVDLGVAVGALVQANAGEKAYAFHELGPPVDSSADGKWQTIRVTRLDVRWDVDRSEARRWSGVEEETAEFHGVLAGVGALGSVLADLWTRAAWGCWDYVDPDLLEPHNVIRHLAGSFFVGFPKVSAVGVMTSGVLTESCNEIHRLVLKANTTDSAELDAVIARAQLLVDATTTLSVPRDWSSRNVPRTASLFLNPIGQASILLLEDAFRKTRVASLEAQYYRAVLREGWGDGHLASSPARRRSGAGCRDRSMVLSTELVHLHASILSRQLRHWSGQEEAAIGVWIADYQGNVTHHKITAHPSHEVVSGDWKVFWDDGLLEHLRAMRQGALPNETGGILLGVSDHKLRTIHLVEALPAPLDSKSSPEGFTRGKRDVEESRQECVVRTAEMVDYVGEWHSHPPGATAKPSDLDEELLAKLAARLAADGVPGVMLIIGESDLSIELKAS